MVVSVVTKTCEKVVSLVSQPAVTPSNLSRGHVPELSIAPLGADAHDSLTADVLIVPVFHGENGLELAGSLGGAWGRGLEITLWKLLVSLGAQGTPGEVTTVPAASIFSHDDESEEASADSTKEPSPFTTIIAIGLGDSDELTAETIREGAGTAIRAVQRTKDQEPASVVSMLGIFDPEAAVIGHALGAYTYAGFKEAKPSVATVSVVTPPATEEDNSADELLQHARVLVDSVALARDLVNAPANVLYPESYAAFIKDAAEAEGLEVEILEESQLEEQGYGGILGVGQGSARPPRLVRVSYNKDAQDTPLVALVGKGITFDTGGISLKPGANMWNMISDMGGSAAVVGSIIAATRLGLNLRVTATIPLAENMPGDKATRPGDIIVHYGGLSSEVLNTDAEGRLVLADAIARACEDEPAFLIETATLTGAQMVALGERTPGIMGSIEFRDRVSMISQNVGENAWPMPLPKELAKEITSDVADLKNISTSRWGGMSVAGHYLSKFVAEGVQWVHMDVAGPAYNTGSAHGYTPKRGTGVPVRTIVASLEAIARGEVEH
ncbi:leucyl aminopeptidase [Corynebacterium sp. 320]|uniref:leucyl aminopeptidase n=1 Tax=Corynebacterium TaxID=1716 RepID=UPI00125CBBBB|nr:leucyl aminopeptidase [Corynebacterium sp. 320]KAB1551311.1 leucyl aminopeptidase [Corynebacterium sp. 321]KAB1551861.1 leucyl aminopeptidase [Corynebacterium sp. 319]KAB3526075.1 leucyl aminopeptidase [Corynebacterium sp. 250]KAB3538855.1 leucyl aminopeptidase [Corynebacterium sp. 366]QNP92807.1 leucyl aminopeptidase [Corynebacterium zhongnanshanii]